MTRRLIVMRHAKSDWDDPSLPDHDRPLNQRGRRAAPRMAEQMICQNVRPDVIVASTAVRVRETLELMQPKWLVVWGEPIEVLREKSLYLATPETLISNLRGLHDSWSSAMLVGHNPGLSMLVSQFAHEPLELPTAAVAVLDSEAESWPEATVGVWKLTNLWLPREL